MEFCRKCAFAALHIFPYSRRAGTPADKMEGQIEKKEKSRRSALAGAMAEELQKNYNTALLGTVQQVLFEQEEDGFFTGHAKNGVKVCARGENLHNVTKNVSITALKEEGVAGEILAPDVFSSIP